MVTNREFQLKADVLHEMEEEAGTQKIKVAEVNVTATKKAPSNVGFISPLNKLSMMKSPTAGKPPHSLNSNMKITRPQAP
jgi:hypothetical protein